MARSGQHHNFPFGTAQLLRDHGRHPFYSFGLKPLGGMNAEHPFLPIGLQSTGNLPHGGGRRNNNNRFGILDGSLHICSPNNVRRQRYSGQKMLIRMGVVDRGRLFGFRCPQINFRVVSRQHRCQRSSPTARDQHGYFIRQRGSPP
ncbi:hypothetical protein D3C74_403170 [compost metagenome]